MHASPTEAAREVLTVVPLVMGTIRAEMRACRSHGLSVPQFRTLGFVHRYPGQSLSEAADHIGLTLPAMSRLIDGLVECRLMMRRPHPSDRRFVALDLTPRGRRLLESALATTLSALAERFSALEEADAAAVARAMRIVRPLFERDDAHGRNGRPAAFPPDRRRASGPARPRRRDGVLP